MKMGRCIRMSSGSRRRVKRERRPLSREDRILPATRRDDAIPQRADVVGDGLPVAEPGSVEVRFCIAAPLDAQDMPNRASTDGMVRNFPLVA